MTSSNTPRVAIIFWRLGPYHHARLNAAGRLLDIYGVEACAAENTYAWDKVDGAESFQRITLTEKSSQEKAWRIELRKRMSVELDRIKPDVVVVPGWSLDDALAAMDWCRRNQVPIITMSESTAWDEPRKPWKEWVKHQVVDLCSAALVGGTPHKEYIVQLGMPENRVFLGYDAVDNHYFREKADSVRADSTTSRLALGSLLAGPFFLASARFIEKKNLPRLLEAYALYRKRAESKEQGAGRHPTSEICSASRGPVVPWSLVLLGDGELKPALTGLRSSLGLDDCVHMPGFKQYPELPHYYAHAGAFVHASTTEQWGLVVNEAMASGLPVLVSNRCGCARDLVQEGINGFTFDPYNVEQLAELMLRLSSMLPAQRSMLADASRQIVAEWGPERFAAGVKAAAECALRVGPKKPTFIQKAILNLLLRR